MGIVALMLKQTKIVRRGKLNVNIKTKQKLMSERHTANSPIMHRRLFCKDQNTSKKNSFKKSH